MSEVFPIFVCYVSLIQLFDTSSTATTYPLDVVIPPCFKRGLLLGRECGKMSMSMLIVESSMTLVHTGELMVAIHPLRRSTIVRIFLM